MKNIACLLIVLTKHVKYTYLYLFKLVLYSILAFKASLFGFYLFGPHFVLYQSLNRLPI